MKPVIAALIMSFTLCSSGFADEELKDGNIPAPATDAAKIETDQSTDKPAATPTSNMMSEPPGKPMAFMLHEINGGQCPACRWISAEGNIVPDTPTVFNHFLADNKLDAPLTSQNGLLISFHSGGGDLLAAIALGSEIRKYNFNTTIGETINKPSENAASDKAPDKDEKNEHKTATNSDSKPLFERIEGICQEACVWAFLGGRARNVAHGKLELRTYRPPLDGAGTTSGQEVSVRKQQLADIAYIADYSQEMGFNPQIAFLNWDNANSHIFSDDEIIAYNINFSPDLIGKWQLVPTEKSLAAIALSNDKKTTARLYCDSHKAMFLEINGLTRYSAENYQNYQQTVSTLNIWGMPINIGQLQLNLSEGHIVYTIELPKNPLQNWHVDAPYLKGENVPEPLRDMFNVEFSDMAGLKQVAAFVLENCPTMTK